jgi:hypothetical protein
MAEGWEIVSESDTDRVLHDPVTGETRYVFLDGTERTAADGPTKVVVAVPPKPLHVKQAIVGALSGAVSAGLVVLLSHLVH